MAQVEQAVRLQFPDLASAPVTSLGHGWANDAFRVGDWVFRFPRRREIVDEIEWEAQVGRVAAEVLKPVGLSVPVVERWGKRTDAFPYPFTGYRFVPGVAADAIDPSYGGEHAEQLGAALRRLHAIPRQRWDGVPPQEIPDVCGRYAAKVRHLSHRFGGEPDDIRSWTSGVIEHPTPDPYRGPFRFLHNDLCPDHVLADPATGRIVGLIDFADAAYGDPVLDFTVLPGWLGWAHTRRALGAYGEGFDSGFMNRLRFLACTLTLVWLDEAHAVGGDVDKHRSWVRRAFEEESR